jgi:hypothetical protein
MNRYPVRVRARLDTPGRWLWLVKWLLLIPHYIVLAFLGLAFIVLTLVAYLAVLFTGRYPRGLFDLLIGISRWTLRVVAFVALLTEIYPPFRLDQGEGEPDDDPHGPTGSGPAGTYPEAEPVAARA